MQVITGSRITDEPTLGVRTIRRILLHHRIITRSAITNVQGLTGIHINNHIAAIRLFSESKLLSFGPIAGVQLNSCGIRSAGSRDINTRSHFGTYIDVIIPIRNAHSTHLAHIKGRLRIVIPSILHRSLIAKGTHIHGATDTVDMTAFGVLPATIVSAECSEFHLRTILRHPACLRIDVRIVQRPLQVARVGVHAEILVTV